MGSEHLDKICDAEAYGAHITAFVVAFVKRERRERWLHLLLNRPKQLYRNSSKLHGHLDRSCCTEVSDCTGLLSDNVGMFYDFRDTSVPLLISTKRAIELGEFRDAIFSQAPGTLALYFFHEGTTLICRGKKSH